MRCIPELFFYGLNELLSLCFAVNLFQRADKTRFFNHNFFAVISAYSIQVAYLRPYFSQFILTL